MILTFLNQTTVRSVNIFWGTYFSQCNAQHNAHKCLCATPYWNSNLTSPLSHSRFQDPCSVSITFLFLVLTFAPLICFGTPDCPTPIAYLCPPHSYPYSLFPLTINLVTPSWTYSSPLAAPTSLHCSQ